MISLFTGNPFLLARLVVLLSLVLSAGKATIAPAETGGNKYDPDPYTKVEIFNLLPKGTPFTIHCKSGDFDLGQNVVESGKSYWFKFKDNWFQTTLYFCGVTWKGGRIVFDLYTSKRDMRRCYTYCRWQVKEEYILGFKQNNDVPDIAILWKK